MASNGQTSFLQWKPTKIVTTQDSTYNLRALKATFSIKGGLLRFRGQILRKIFKAGAFRQRKARDYIWVFGKLFIHK